jgi:hypothetical protein
MGTGLIANFADVDLHHMDATGAERRHVMLTKLIVKVLLWRMKVTLEDLTLESCVGEFAFLS